MCSGNQGRQQHHAEEEARRRQAQADEEARRRQEELNRLAQERQAAAAAQQAQMAALQKQQAEQQLAQEQQVAELQSQQAERVGGIRARGLAISQSLQILGQQGVKGPTAATSTSKPQAGGARSTTASLRMGATSRGAGSGANVAV